MLQLTGITKRWGDLVVLDDVSLTLAPGQAVRLTGENGAGKTTLLRIASGLIVPDAGSVAIGDLNPERDRRAYHQQLGFLSAGDRGLYARLSVRHNLEFVAGVSFLRGAQRRDVVSGALDRFDLRALEHRRVDRLSMGQRQRVRLALTFLHDPSVVLLDEPRNSLDEHGFRLLADALDDLTSRNGSALVCAPTEEAAGVPTDVAYVLHDGRLKCQ